MIVEVFNVLVLNVSLSVENVVISCILSVGIDVAELDGVKVIGLKVTTSVEYVSISVILVVGIDMVVAFNVMLEVEFEITSVILKLGIAMVKVEVFCDEVLEFISPEEYVCISDTLVGESGAMELEKIELEALSDLGVVGNIVGALEVFNFVIFEVNSSVG